MTEIVLYEYAVSLMKSKKTYLFPDVSFFFRPNKKLEKLTDEMPTVTGLSPSSLRDLITNLGDSRNRKILSRIDPSILKNVAKRFESVSESENLNTLVNDLAEGNLREALEELDKELLRSVARRLREECESTSCVRLFVAGSKTHVGKTTICLGILGTLIKMGFRPSDLAYVHNIFVLQQFTHY